MSNIANVQALISKLLNVDINGADSISTAASLLMDHFNKTPENVVSDIEMLSEYFTKNQFMTELLISAINRLKHNLSSYSLEYPNVVESITNAGDLFVFGPSPSRISTLITKIDQVSRKPEFIAMAPSLTKDIIHQWLVREQPASQYPGCIAKAVNALQIAFASNPIRIAIINKAFTILTDQASKDPALIGWLTFALNNQPKLRRVGDDNSYMDVVVPEFDTICQRIDGADKSDPEADGSIMLVIAKWIHMHGNEDVDIVKNLFNALAERYIDNEPTILLLNKALGSLYELGTMTDEPTILKLLAIIPRLSIGPSVSECQTLGEQIEFWLAEGNIHAASQLLDSWKVIRSRLIQEYPDVLENMLYFLAQEFSETPELKSQINEILLMQNKV